MKEKKEKNRKLEYYIINSKVQTQKEDTEQFYSELMEKWFDKGYKIMTKSDPSHYYTLTSISKSQQIRDKVAYYGVMSKFVKMDDLDFIESDTGNLVEFDLPKNIEARQLQYEFVFFPYCHRFAFIKAGKINPLLKKRGAPLQKTLEIIKLAFESASGNNNVFIELQQSKLIFEDIFNNKLLSLKVRISYTNDDNLNEEHQKILDEQMKSAGISQFIARMAADNPDGIDAGAALPSGFIALAAENGEVDALLQYDDGNRKRINTRNFPEVDQVNIKEGEFSLAKVFSSLLSKFIGRY